MVSIYNIVSFNWSINSIYFKTPIFLNTREIEAYPASASIFKKNIWSFRYNCISFIIIIIVIIINIIVIIIIIIIIIILLGVYEINPIRATELRSN